MDFGIFNKIKSFFSPDTQQVSEVKSLPEKKNTETIPIAGENKEKPVDKVEIKSNSRDKIYNRLADFCEEYRIKLEDIKKAELLENIAGVDDISTLSEEEISRVFIALKDSLGITGHWKAFWEDRNIDDVLEIAKDANRRYINNKTGGGFWGQLWHDITTSESLKEAIGYKEGDNFEAKLQEYFKENYLKGIENLPEAERAEAYRDALKKFGYFMNNATDLDKKALIAVIRLLRAQDRANAANISITSCGKNKHARSKVAESIEEKRFEIVTEKDAFNERPNQFDSAEIADLTFSNMDEEATAKALDNMTTKSRALSSRIDEINKKKANGTITQEEAIELAQLEASFNNYTKAGYSGALIGIQNNSLCSQSLKSSATKQIFEDAQKQGILDEVSNIAIKYLSNNNKLSADTKANITNTLNKAIVSYNNESTSINSDNKPKTEKMKNNRDYSRESEEITIASKNNSKPDATDINKKAYKDNTFTYSKSLTEAKQQQNQINRQYSTNSIQKDKVNPFTPSENNKNTTLTAIKNADMATVIKEMGFEGFSKKIESNGATKAVSEVYNNLKDINNKAVVLEAEKLYKTFDASRQADVLRFVGNEGLNELLKITSVEALKMLQGETFSNYWATEQVRNAVIEATEKDKKAQENLYV